MNLFPIVDSRTLPQRLLANLEARTAVRGQWTLPCVPAAGEYYLQRLIGWFADWGKPLRPDEVEQVRARLHDQLAEGFRQNAGAKLVIDFDLTVAATLQKNLALQITHLLPNLADEYAQWVGQDAQPLFGAHPDARVLKAIKKFPSPAGVRVLDVGAGDGRNAVPLALLGCQVDAVELTPPLADRLRRAAHMRHAPIRVWVGDLFDDALSSAMGTYQLVILSGVVSHFRSPAQLGSWLAKLAQLLAPGGQSVFNIFLADEDYQPDDLARQLSQVSWASLFTREELRTALIGLPLQVVGDDPVFEYERTHLPPSAWPPTPWFETWSLGRSIIPVTEGRPPFQMYWIAVERQ